MPALGHHHHMELTKSVTFHDFCDIRQRIAKSEAAVLEEEDEYEEDSSSTQHSNSSSPASQLETAMKGANLAENGKEKKKVNRRGLPLNNSFSSWLQIFLSKKRKNGGFGDRGSFSEARLASIRPSVSLCKDLKFGIRILGWIGIWLFLPLKNGKNVQFLKIQYWKSIFNPTQDTRHVSTRSRQKKKRNCFPFWKCWRSSPKNLLHAFLGEFRGRRFV
jgi:hypothetical protein